MTPRWGWNSNEALRLDYDAAALRFVALAHDWLCNAGHDQIFRSENPMNPEFAIELVKTMMFQAVSLAAPILLTAMAVGLAVSLFQAVTTIHEQTLAFVPKVLAIVGILVLLLPWILRSLIEFTTAVIQKMPQMAT